MVPPAHAVRQVLRSARARPRVMIGCTPCAHLQLSLPPLDRGSSSAPSRPARTCPTPTPPRRPRQRPQHRNTATDIPRRSSPTVIRRVIRLPRATRPSSQATLRPVIPPPPPTPPTRRRLRRPLQLLPPHLPLHPLRWLLRRPRRLSRHPRQPPLRAARYPPRVPSPCRARATRSVASLTATRSTASASSRARCPPTAAATTASWACAYPAGTD